MTTPSYCIGNINPGTVRAEYMHSLIDLMQSEDRGKFVKYITKANCGPYLDVARNFVVQEFMKEDAEVLLFVDSDIEFKVSDVRWITEAVDENYPVVGGYYANAFPGVGVRPVAMNWVMVEGKPTTMKPIDNPSRHDHVLNVDCVGTGFMAIHRSVLTQMSDTYSLPTPWFAEVARYGNQMGEDVTFCQRVKQLGHPVLIDFKVRLAHFKTQRITTNTTITE